MKEQSLLNKELKGRWTFEEKQENYKTD